MQRSLSRKTILWLLFLGILGCLFMGGSDYLMIYGDPAYEGKLAWLTVGAAAIPAWRNSLSLLLAFPAVILYSFGLFGIRHLIREQKPRKIYTGLTALGMTPWLCLHLFYIMILYLFAFLSGQGQGALGSELGEAMVSHFGWLIPLGEAIILLPFLYFFCLTLTRKTVFSRWMALNNPLLIYVLLKALTLIMPPSAFQLAFVNGLMSESMLIWFLILIFALPPKIPSAQ